jgi:transcriptional regulator with XRE-family HTH domain
MLRETRIRAGFRSQAALAKEIHLSRPVISRAENPAHPVPSDDVLKEWARVTDADLEEMRELAARATGDAPEWFTNYLAAEQEATIIRLWGPMIFPGLLQTEAYAREILSVYQHAPERLEGLLAVRMKRQEAIGRARITALIGASVFSRPIGSAAVMAEQCAHLVDLAEREQILLYVVPDDVNAGAWADINIASRGSTAMVCLTTGTTDVPTTAPEQIDMAVTTLERLIGTAMPLAESLDFARKWRDEWKSRT